MSTTRVRQQGEEQLLTWLSSYSKDVVFNREHDRMRAQHAIVRATMQDRFIHAPVNATAPSPELRILDSACNDETWMLDVIMDRITQLQVQPDIKLHFLNTDLDQKHFSDLDLSSALPSNVSITFHRTLNISFLHFVRMKLSVLIWSVPTLLVTVSSTPTCYYPNGQVASNYIPCNSSVVSVCCPSTDPYLSNGLCYSVAGSYPYRACCTEQTWQSDACLSYCRDAGMRLALPSLHVSLDSF
jgi:hypothetical protein